LLQALTPFIFFVVFVLTPSPSAGLPEPRPPPFRALPSGKAEAMAGQCLMAPSYLLTIALLTIAPKRKVPPFRQLRPFFM
jgi:hypothetical protein